MIADRGGRVILTAGQVAQVRSMAAAVHERARARGWQHKWPLRPGQDPIGYQVDAFAAELAASLRTGLPWHAGVLGTDYRRSDKRPDLGRRTEVRSSTNPNGGLWSHPDNDRDEWLYLFVVGRCPDLVVVGWVEGRDLRVPRHWHDGIRGGPSGWRMDPRDLRPLPVPEDA